MLLQNFMWLFFPFSFFFHIITSHISTLFFFLGSHGKILQLDRHHLAKVGFGFYVYHNCGFTTYDLSGPKHVVLDNKIRWVQYWVLSTRANQSKQNHTLFLNITIGPNLIFVSKRGRKFLSDVNTVASSIHVIIW